MIDKNLIGYQFQAVTLTVEEGRLKFLAKALGETGEIYTNPDAAKAAGLPGLLAPPTFPFILEIDALDLVDFMELLGESLENLLHGEENFNYYAPIYAGDKITVSKVITDIIDKKEGALQFVKSDNTFTNQKGIVVAETHTNYVFRK
ncbi:MAG: MaoC family dehydratase N-terminal domain-containing protein [SAR324 cluster bacterium]|nr:MaoC family dehydratase N-terminal domain-containing protein [SAR324 cluster bacterium]MBL7034921.1 MaoC family dehydratase N-terminal domain-containing protein [SAR324 cluster bacterium]